MRKPLLLLLLTAVCASGCAIGALQEKPAAKDLLAPGTPSGGTGIALAGGGTKAASYAMGVLSAVAEKPEGFTAVNAISTVSGGGYAAFFLYSKLLWREDERIQPKPDVSEFFKDCIPHTYDTVLPDMGKGLPLCDTEPTANTKYRFQQFVRCRQDVLENDCHQQLNTRDPVETEAAAANTLGIGVATGVALVPNFVSRTLFDWPINMSPSRFAYHKGIGTAYGLYPLISGTTKQIAGALRETSDIAETCTPENFLNCDLSFGVAQLNKKEKLRFKDLKALIKHDPKLPTWIINATGPEYRSLYGWAQKGQRNFQQFTVQMSPFGARSGFYGSIPNYKRQLSLLDAVAAAAAFFDPNETNFEQPWRMGLAMAQHAAVLDWGIDINNPKVGNGWRIVHPMLPSPLYYLGSLYREIATGQANQRSAYIRLMDGGNNDNLGAYTLLEAGMKEVFIADEAQDEAGLLADLCRLHNEVQLRSPVKGTNMTLLVPGLEDFAVHCKKFMKSSACTETESKHACRKRQKEVPSTIGHYPILQWKYPVVLGCIIPKTPEATVCDDAPIRVYLLKPALDLEQISKLYLNDTPGGGWTVKPEACNDPTAPTCELAAFIATKRSADRHEGLGSFPQDSTAGMTYASNGRLYAGYRELARWQMRKALALAPQQGDSSHFTTEAKRQAHCPIRRLVLDPPKTDQPISYPADCREKTVDTWK